MLSQKKATTEKMKQYAIKVCLNPANDDWIYITENTRNCMDLRPVLFDDEESAENYAITWRLEGKADMVKVVEYEN